MELLRVLINQTFLSMLHCNIVSVINLYLVFNITLNKLLISFLNLGPGTYEDKSLIERDIWSFEQVPFKFSLHQRIRA